MTNFQFTFDRNGSLNSNKVELFFLELNCLQVYFGLNFLGGFMLVCCILPIDLMVMSYMRYIRFEFEVLKNDLVNLILFL